MKILIGADTYAPDMNGAARFAERLATGMVGRGHDVHVVCASDSGALRTEHVDGVTVHRIRSHRYPLHPTLRICLPWQANPATDALVTALRPDVIHVQSHMVVGRGLARAATRHATSLVATNHFMPENVLGYLPVPRFAYGLVSRLAWRDLGRVFAPATVITAPTPRAVELLAQNTSLTEVVSISCGIEHDQIWQAALQAPAPIMPTVLFVGRLDPEKRIDELIRAMARLPLDRPARLEIVGCGDQREHLQRLAKALGIADRVIFRGRVDEAQLIEAYGRASVFCMPGIAELQSLVTLEAMAAGKPVIAADAMALPHLVHPGVNGELFAPGDVAGLAHHLKRLLGDASLRRRYGQASREVVASHAFAATLDAFEATYLVPASQPVKLAA